MTLMLEKHPAPWHTKALAIVKRMIDEEYERRPALPFEVLDPFAGTGRIHRLDGGPIVTVGVELEPEWAACDERTMVGNALALPEDWAGRFRVVAEDPTYGNRMADQHDARDACKQCEGTGCWLVDKVIVGHACRQCGGTGKSRRHTYRHTLGRPLTRGSSAGLQWGKGYRQFHELHIREALRVLVPDGLMIVAMKNHIRDGQEQLVAEWWVNMLLYHKCRLQEIVPIDLAGVTHGKNHEKRVESTFLIVVRTPA